MKGYGSRPLGLLILLILLAPPGSSLSAADEGNASLQALSDMASSVTSVVDEAPTRLEVERSLSQLPLLFIENCGQLNDQVTYYLPGSDKEIYFSQQGVTFALTTGQQSVDDRQEFGGMHPLTLTLPSSVTLSPSRPLTSTLARWAVKLDFIGANPDVRPVGEKKAETVFSYFRGSQDEWCTGLPSYQRLVYQDLWPGIDLVYYGTKGQLKYEFVVHPGADPAQIQLAYRGATGVVPQSDGRLEVATPVGNFHDGVPFAYQDIGGQRFPVAMNYRLTPVVQGTGEQVTFEGTVFDLQPVTLNFAIGDYDPAHSLVLDPAFIVGFSSLLGGSNDDRGYGIAIDGAGNAYITGETTSANFPVTVGPDLTYNNGDQDAFVAKVNTAGTGLIYASFLGGSGFESGWGIAVDGSGGAYITGRTSSLDFPTTSGWPYQTLNGSLQDAFVVKIDAYGTGLVYAGYLGGNNWDFGAGIAVDGVGSAYVVGTTSSANFPVTGGPDISYNGSIDAFLAKVNAAGTGLAYAGYLGGNNWDFGAGIAVDSVGNAYITGYTASSDFPAIVGPDLTHNGGEDVFVAKINGSGMGLIFAGFVGGSSDERSTSIAIDGMGNAYITGSTESADFPTVVGPDLTYNGWIDVFVIKVNASGTSLIYAGFLGTSSAESGYGIAVDGTSNAYITGSTWSPDFPVIGGPDLTHNGASDTFVAKLNTAGTGLVYSSFLGGSQNDEGMGIVLNSSGSSYLTGYTLSNDFPTTNELGSTQNGNGDAFVAKITVINPPEAPTLYTVANSDGDGDFGISWNAVTGATNYILQEAVNSSFLNAVIAYSGNRTGTSLYSRRPGTYYYRVQASSIAGTGPWSNVQSVSVVVVPVAPVLDPIINSQGHGDYVVTWNPVVDIALENDFENAHGGFVGQGSWAWGVVGPYNGVRPDFPNGARSGAKAWGTNLTGDYGDAEEIYLTSPVVDLRDFQGALKLSWWQWLRTESGFDYASVEVRGGTSDWRTVYGPVSGMVDLQWARREYDISYFTGVSDFQVRFGFRSDGSVVYPGWYVDDLALHHVTGASGYRLQEATDSYFFNPVTVYSGDNTQTSISAKERGLYYYRVQSYNARGTSSWSNIRSVIAWPSCVYLPVTLRDYLQYFEGPWEVEPNDTYLQANGPLISGRNYTAYPNDARDYFSVYVRRPGTLTVSITNHTGQLVQLQLFYQGLANNVYGKPAPPWEFTYEAQPGWYYIYIYTDAGHNSTTPYTLRVMYLE
ncbi:MAG: SBBP repeat-containing protein [Anaerolineae bacterium]|jgi:hypothetical protein|nr:SBBP repeat-containing protein [Anaerolineae bacterium]